MKILMVVPAIKREDSLDYSSLIKNEIQGLIRAGVEVSVFKFKDRKSLSEIRKVITDLKRIIRSESIDLIHFQTGPAAIPILFFTPTVPTVITIGGSDILGYRGKGVLWRLKGYLPYVTSILCSMRSNKIICVSENLKDKLPVLLWKKVHIQPRGINIDHFKVIPKEKARSLLSWEPTKKIVLFAYTHKNPGVKNLPLAQRAIKLLRSDFSESVEFVYINNKSRDEVTLMLCAGDSLLVTSLHEGSPNIVKEAMACNLPVVSVKCGDVKERLHKAVNCHVVNKYSAAELAKALKEVLIIGERSNGRQTLLDDGLNLTSTSRNLKELYDTIISNN